MLSQATRSITANPLGLSIDFLFGRGYLWARHERVSDWLTLDALRMEIPDLKFPFDARGGMGRFQATRCLVREIEVTISEVGLAELIGRAAAQIDGFEGLSVRALEDVLHVDVRAPALGGTAPISFKVALIPPEPARDDELHLSLYDYRAYGPLPVPARTLAFELMTRLLGAPALRPPGRGAAFTVGVAGDILSLRPLKLLLLHLFPRVGWKLPSLAGVVLDEARVSPGQLRLRATSRDASWYSKPQRERGQAPYQLAATPQGAAALAAYEAKDLFAPIDQSIFDGEPEQALALLATYRDVYGAHPELVERALDLLLADPSATHLAEARELTQALMQEAPDALHVLRARHLLDRLEHAPREQALASLHALADALRQRQELHDWLLCMDEAARLMEGDAEALVALLREVIAVAPRNQRALERLRDLYEKLGMWTEHEDILKRLTSVHASRHELMQTYLALADHLLHRRGQSSEARLYLERALRLEPDALDALHMLGQSYALTGQPLRALKAFGSAARAAESHEALDAAAGLHLRISRLWRDDLDNPAEALLSCRRAIELRRALAEQAEETTPDLALVDLYEYAAELCTQRERWDEALVYALEVTPRLEALLAGIPEGPAQTPAWMRDALVRLHAAPHEVPESPERQQLRARVAHAHERLARLYERRGRPDAATPHWKKVISLRPQDHEAIEHLEVILTRGGSPEELIAFYKSLIDRERGPERRLTLHLKLARLYDTIQLVEEAREQLDEALKLDPHSATARARLVDMLQSAGRFETLQGSLHALLLRATRDEVRHDVLHTLGQLHLRALDQPRQAARAFMEALELRPRDRDALFGARDALEQIVTHEGMDATAPVGQGLVGPLLERVLVKLVELVDDPLDAIATLERLAVVAEELGDHHLASEAAARAARQRDRLDADRSRAGARVDARLDALLQPEAATLDPSRHLPPSPRDPSPEAQDARDDDPPSLGDQLHEPGDAPGQVPARRGAEPFRAGHLDEETQTAKQRQSLRQTQPQPRVTHELLERFQRDEAAQPPPADGFHRDTPTRESLQAVPSAPAPAPPMGFGGDPLPDSPSQPLLDLSFDLGDLDELIEESSTPLIETSAEQSEDEASEPAPSPATRDRRGFRRPEPREMTGLARKRLRLPTVDPSEPSEAEDEAAQPITRTGKAPAVDAFRTGFRDIWRSSGSLGDEDALHGSSSLSDLLRTSALNQQKHSRRPRFGRPLTPKQAEQVEAQPTAEDQAPAALSEPSEAYPEDTPSRSRWRFFDRPPTDISEAVTPSPQPPPEREDANAITKLPGVTSPLPEAPQDEGHDDEGDEPGEAPPSLAGLPDLPMLEGDIPILDRSTARFNVRHLLNALSQPTEASEQPLDYSLDELSAAFGVATSRSGPAHGLGRDSDTSEASGEGAALDAALTRLNEARALDDPEALAAALEDVLERDAAQPASQLPQTRRLTLTRELGEVLYFELEDATRALPHLERVRREDPDGLGASPALLTALESIYEERGAARSRLELLRARLARAESTDLKSTYHLLIAQLAIDELEDEAMARVELDAVLAHDPQSESAHRLLAQMARDRGDYADAARHIERVLEQRSGGLDEVELERELATLYLERLDDPMRAREHYEGVLREAPADAQAIAGLMASCRAMEDWRGVIQTLGRELALLCARLEPIDLLQPDPLDLATVRPAVRQAANQIVAEAARLALDHLRRLDVAWTLWGLAFALWEEDADALEQRVALGRELGRGPSLVDDLERLSDLLLDPTARFDALREAAWLCHGVGEDARAVDMLERALEIGARGEIDADTLAEAARDLSDFSQA